MELSDEKVQEYVKRLLQSRMRLLCNYGFYGLLLMHIIFALDDEIETITTDGERIYFNPEFLDGLTDQELDYYIMHQILHLVLDHPNRSEDKSEEEYDRACDIVVNSILLESFKENETKISVKGNVSEHKTPNGLEGRKFTAEQVYEMLKKERNNKNNDNSSQRGLAALLQDNKVTKINGQNDGKNIDGASQIKDDHSKWPKMKDEKKLRDAWQKYLQDACETMQSRGLGNGHGCGSIPAFAERFLQELKKPQTDWRSILNDFVQEEITDYSFTPPDRRFDDGDFFLPDFNEKDDMVEDILFMVDTSASMDEEAITAAYSEIKGAIDQFNGKLKGWLGFFDAAVVEPKPFENEDEFKIIRPKGGGGTSFHVIFEHVKDKMMSKIPSSIIIFTDGFAPFPRESDALGVPVLWLIDNEDVNPPWGKVARFTA